MRWDGFAGNDAAKRTIETAIESGRLPHALLVEGPRGSGRKTFAHQIAKAAVCLSRDEKPCGVCGQCVKVDTGHPDITVLQGDGSAKSLNVNMIRELREQAAVVPNEANYKVAIIADAGCMNVQAQNALLKILEEPPSYMLFILTAESRTQFLPTVQSRCVSINLLGVTESEAMPVLRSRLPELTDAELTARLRLFSGCIGAVLDSVGNDDFAQTVRLITDIATAIRAPYELALMQAIAPLEKDKILTDAVLSGLRFVVRDALVMSMGGTVTVGVAPDASSALSQSLTQKRLLALLDVLDEMIASRKRNMNQSLLITLLCARLRAVVG
ncbi:MAG: hypothetical protein IKV35_03530 [Clostridia bacterium]|nr:hypothetical protein [Clostridia bacterium]